MTGRPLLEVQDLVVTYGRRRRAAEVRALRGVSFSVAAGETVSVVGESGTGKSTLGGAVMGFVPVAGGSIRFDSQDLTHASFRQRRTLGSQIQVVFQNPHSSFNPTRRVGDTVAEPLLAGAHRTRGELRQAVGEILRRVELPTEMADSYPRQLSGGQLQRLAIARALIASPRLIVMDEALSALDLSVQAQIVNLLLELRSEFGLAYLFIAHDLDIVRHVSHRVLVLYRGSIVESGTPTEVCGRPRHPYTRELVGSVPIPDPALQRKRRIERGRRETTTLSGSSSHRGCTFADRCRYAIEVCAHEPPAGFTTPDGGIVMCHRYPELAVSGEPPHASYGRCVDASRPTRLPSP